MASCAFTSGLSQTEGRKTFAEVSGTVWDSLQGTSLSATTVAIYKKDSVLVAYTISDNRGSFVVKNLPTGIPLKVIASFVGYTTAEKTFMVPSSIGVLDLGRIHMKPGGSTMETIIVKAIPPVVMKGDTLEFNADAFKLDKNAQAEDLLRILPGVMIWSDGTITVNGQEVSSVLVNGKPFFGNDARIATQNLPKNIIDKVQVYQKNTSETTPVQDSLTEINIKLKKGMESGYFGKVGAGYGTDRTAEVDASLNLFNKRTQLSIAGIHNNVNKDLSGMQVLLANHTFKGAGLDMSYQSDFNRKGLNTVSGGGFSVQHNFSGLPGQGNLHGLNAEGFFSRNKSFLVADTRARTTLNDSQYFQRDNTSESDLRLQAHNTHFNYRFGRKKDQFNLWGTYSRQQQESVSHSVDRVTDEAEKLLSENVIGNNNASTSNQVSVNLGYTHDNDAIDPELAQKPFSSYSLDYRFNRYDMDNRLLYRSSYEVLSDPLKSRILERQYDNQVSNQNHYFIARIPKLLSRTMGKRFFGRLGLGFENAIGLRTHDQVNRVSDKKGSAALQFNPYLTNTRDETNVTLHPAMALHTNWDQSRRGGNSRHVSVSIKAGPQFLTQNSSSQKQFQQFSRQYKGVVGNLGLTYTTMRTYVSRKMMRLDFSSTPEYPTLDQLAPLIDSADLNFIQTGNLSLKEQNKRSVRFSLDHSSLKRKKDFSYQVRLTGEQVDDYFAQNSYIDTLGRIISNTVNASGYLNASAGGELRKVAKQKNSQVEMLFLPEVSLSNVPQYINGVKTLFVNLSTSVNPSIAYSYSNKLVMQMGYHASYNQYRESGGGIRNHSFTNHVSYKLHVTLAKKLALSTNVSHNRTRFNQDQPINFTLWNGYIIYRMLEGNNAELKFSALDILKQNKILNTYGANNTLTQVRTNALQQYFMLTLSYYPRKFGKK